MSGARPAAVFYEGVDVEYSHFPLLDVNTQSFEVAEKAARALEAARPKVLGFDIEWQVSFVAGEVKKHKAQIFAPTLVFHNCTGVLLCIVAGTMCKTWSSSERFCREVPDEYCSVLEVYARECFVTTEQTHRPRQAVLPFFVATHMGIRWNMTCFFHRCRPLRTTARLALRIRPGTTEDAGTVCHDRRYLCCAPNPTTSHFTEKGMSPHLLVYSIMLKYTS